MDRIVNKLTSGRFLITVILTIVLVISIILNTEFLTIYTILAAFYFGKERQDSTINEAKEIDKAEYR